LPYISFHKSNVISQTTTIRQGLTNYSTNEVRMDCIF
jgi:hypothetical protein